MTNNFLHPEELPGIRDEQAKVFKYGGTYVQVRPLTTEDLKDDDFIQWLQSMWKHDETSVKMFIKNKKYHEIKTKSKFGNVQTSTAR